MTLTSDQVRRAFIEFFKRKPAGAAGPGGAGGHTFVPSSPVVPHDDPTLLFTNAGMNQFKPIFLGTVAPGSPLAGLKRAVNSQKCIRAGGKHNDLEDVGKDTYHHTFFEMLGNWSFGDYFKAESIAWGVELLTKTFGIPPERLYATYFEGDAKQNLEPDLEARDLWLNYLPKDHVLPGNARDNFWEMGETGPCGPCSEIHYDRIGGRNAAEIVNRADPNVIEIWNHVFIQFNREEDRSLKLLPAKHVDTGMGFERLLSVLQNKSSNYDTDLFMPIFARIEHLVQGRHQYRGRLGAMDKGNIDTAFRVIADHIRTLTFAITDGGIPSNEGRGYVLRRILRRAVRYGRQVLEAKPGFFRELVPVVVEKMGHAFPELEKNPQRVIDILKDEEDSFGRTWDRGVKLFDEAAATAVGRAAVEKSAKATVSADDVFKLYDTYGFPADLTRLMADERGLGVDVAGYERLMEQARDKARAASKFSAAGADLELKGDETARLMRLGVQPTEDVDKFHGRDIRARVKAIWNGENFDEFARASGATSPVAVILDRTNFYAEMGGQVGDHGRVLVTREAGAAGEESRTGGEFRVEDTRAYGGYVLHIGVVVKGEVRVNDEVQLIIDKPRRALVAGNHTATHLLNLALRQHLGEGADQKGSLVAPDRFRFDFSWTRPLTTEELATIEHDVRKHVSADLKVYAETAPLYVGRQINGVRAVFGETYPDPVRVVSIGNPVGDLLADASAELWHDFSVEFCGGTHVGSTKDVGHFALVSEEGIAKGVRRITAVTGVAARAADAAADNLASRVRQAETLADEALAAESGEIVKELEQLTIPAPRKQQIRAMLGGLQERVKAAQKKVAAQKAAHAAGMARDIAQSAIASNERVIVTTVETGSDKAALQAAVTTLTQLVPKAAVLLIAPDREENKASLAAAVPAELVAKGLKAGDWIREASAVMGGKGGGKPDSASGGGTDLSKLKEAIAAARLWANKKVL
jgi:alanyl-tRNA synthetase